MWPAVVDAWLCEIIKKQQWYLVATAAVVDVVLKIKISETKIIEVAFSVAVCFFCV